MRILLIMTFLFSVSAFANKKATINYEYKKYERFDFDALDVEGARPSPGELSIPTRVKSKHQNKLPERKDFNREMKRAIDTVI